MFTQQKIITSKIFVLRQKSGRNDAILRNNFPLCKPIFPVYRVKYDVITDVSNVLRIKKSNKNIIYIPVIRICVKRLEVLRHYVVFKLRTCGNTRFYYVMKNSPGKARNA